jgi:lipoprotein-releasing system permease protein
MIRGITDRYLELGTGHLQIYNYAFPSYPEEALDNLNDIKGIRGVWPERHGMGVLVGPKGSRGATIRAVEKSFWEDEGSLKFLSTVSGEAKIESDGEVLLGEALADSLGVEIGSTVRIMTISAGSEGKTLPRLKPFTVKGIVSSGYRELDSLWCIMSLDAGKAFLSELSESYLMLKIDDPYGGADIMAGLIGGRLGGGFGVYTWKQLQRSQYSSYESTRQLLLFIMALIVMVAAVNVSAATSMLVLERRRDIAVLKASGASPGFTGSIFLWGAILTGALGSIAGLSAGLLIGASVNLIIHSLEGLLSFVSGLFNGGSVKILDSGFYLETIPIIIDWKAVCFIGGFTVLSSALASWIPVRRAGKTKPVEILRKY